MDHDTLWYGAVLLLGMAAPYLLTQHECWELGLWLPTPQRVSRCARWAVIYSVVSFAFCIDIAGCRIDVGWGAVILLNALFWSPMWVWVRSLGRPEWTTDKE